MASGNVVRLELMKLFVAYPQATRSEDELPLVLELWSEGLELVDDSLLPAAMAAHRKASKFFPTIAEIVALAGTIAIERTREFERACAAKSLPVGSRSDEDIAKFKENCRRIRELVGGVKPRLRIVQRSAS